MAERTRKLGASKTLVATMTVLIAVMLALPAAALALPSKNPDSTPMIEGRVRAIEQVGNNIWMGGRFSQVTTRSGTVIDSVGNLAVLDAGTGAYKDIAPNFGGTNTEVWDIARYGGTGPHADDLLIAGKFPGPASDSKNLALVDGGTGNVLRWYNSKSLKAVLPAPNTSAPGGDGRVYAGGGSLSAFDFATRDKLWTNSKVTIDPDIRSHNSAPAYRDLLLDGNTIWAACICDFVDGAPGKALIKLDAANGEHDPNWLTDAGAGAFGEAVVEREGKLYLGAGGSDFVAQYGKNNGGAVGWRRDTSGSTQTLEIMGDQLIVGGHFFEVADQAGDSCGKGRPGDTDAQGNPVLDPKNECQRRQGIAAYTFGGVLDPNWNPSYSGGYSLVWALHVDRSSGRLHTGGEFKTVNGIVQHSYARFS